MHLVTGITFKMNMSSRLIVLSFGCSAQCIICNVPSSFKLLLLKFSTQFM